MASEGVKAQSTDRVDARKIRPVGEDPPAARAKTGGPSKFSGYTSGRAREENPDASQAETPTFSVDGRGTVRIGGYQPIVASLGGELRTGKKIAHVRELLKKIRDEADGELLDIGCSNGAAMLSAAACGYKRVRGLEHDRECVAVVEKTLAHLRDSPAWAPSLEGVEIVQGGFAPERAELGKHGAVLASAVIHWLYSATAGFGSLDAVVRAFAAHAKKFLLVEWVDPLDPACKMLGHLEKNPGVHAEAYTLENFVSALELSFRSVSRVRMGSDTATRWFFLASEPVPDEAWKVAAGATADVRILPGVKVVKTVRRTGEFAEHDTFHRELYWLQKLAPLDVAPRIRHINRDKQHMVMSYCGETLAELRDRGETPRQSAAEILRISGVLGGAGCAHNDYRPENVCVGGDGKFRMIDFGWAAAIALDFGCGGGAHPIPEKPYGSFWPDALVPTCE